jgi:hypothetical protein
MAKMYVQIMTQDWFSMPSGFNVGTGRMENDCIAVNLVGGGCGRDDVFDSKNFSPTEWKKCGIEYDPSKKFGLKICVKNLNDVFFAEFFQSNFGNASQSWRIDYGTVYTYAGICSRRRACPMTSVGELGVRGTFKWLQNKAREFRSGGISYMRISSRERCHYTDQTGNVLVMERLHAENIDVEMLLAVDIDGMSPGEIYPFGDRNWIRDSGTNCLPRLAVAMEHGGSALVPRFGMLTGVTFVGMDLISVGIFSHDVVHKWDRKGPPVGEQPLLRAPGTVRGAWNFAR